MIKHRLLVGVCLCAAGIAGCGGSGSTASRTATTGSKSHRKTTKSATAQASTTSSSAATADAASPTACMIKAGLLDVGPASETGTWQGLDPAAGRRAVFVDGPYASPAAASKSASLLKSVSNAAAGGIWEVSSSLRGDTGPAVNRVARCLRTNGERPGSAPSGST